MLERRTSLALTIVITVSVFPAFSAALHPWATVPGAIAPLAPAPQAAHALILVPSGLAATVAKPASPQSPWLWVSTGLLVVLVAEAVYSKLQRDTLDKKLRAEEFRTRELKKRLDMALKNIQKLETNPDLVDSREFNLDYLRLRMQESTFHFAIVNQIKMKVKTLVSVALRPTPQQVGSLQQGSAGHTRQVDQVFPVEYETHDGIKKNKRVLFRIEIRLAKLPTQPSSKTIEELIHCLERYLSLEEEDQDDRWQPTLQGRLASISWDQKAKPTPLLVLEQSQEGSNVTLRSKRGLRD